jgi:hypothetical protein
MQHSSSHSDASGDGTPAEPSVTRRWVLAKSAAILGTGAVTAGGFVSASGVAAGQIIEAAVIPEPMK